MNVQFEEESFSVQPQSAEPVTQGLAGLMMKVGIAKNAFAANALLIAVAVAFIGLTVFTLKVSAAPAPIGPQAEDFYKQGKRYIPGVPLK